jgi:hypothetical protein
LLVAHAVNQLHRLDFDSLDDLFGVYSDFVVSAVIRGGICGYLLEILKELALRSVVLVVQPLQQQVKPHLLRNDLSVVWRDPLLHALLEVNKVLPVLLDIVSEILAQLYELVRVEARDFLQRRWPNNVPEADSHLLLQRRMAALAQVEELSGLAQNGLPVGVGTVRGLEGGLCDDPYLQLFVFKADHHVAVEQTLRFVDGLLLLKVLVQHKEVRQFVGE